MSLYTPPPPFRTADENKPTLLVCWWITLFCTTVILLRIVGRFVRSEKLYREDKIAALAIIPLFLRMGCVHVILIYGTNNAYYTELTDEDLRKKTIASGLVLASRFFYAATYVYLLLNYLVVLDIFPMCRELVVVFRGPLSIPSLTFKC